MMTKTKRIFVDTSAWLAFLLKNEQNHNQVHSYFLREASAESKFVTSDYILDECFTRLMTNRHFGYAKTLQQKLNRAQKDGEILVLYVDQTIFSKSWSNFEKFKEHRLSFTDATVVTFVNDLKIDEILSLDRGFKKIGLKVAP